ncbi:SNAPIN protein homolog [Coccinella septempunctata]|uniref:SNAPIN protein homolog n=1 Tax=Coccinella septempunctata TaxID=41139 RepID=UPI001D086A00|nr:SNAPIN protein homolog [Coccinella septempunctata]
MPFMFFIKNMDSVSDASPSAISFDENTENFCDNPTRDILAEGLMGLIKPTVDQLDERVKLTRLSQLALKDSVETVHDEIKKIIDAQYLSNVDLDSYVKKLYNTKQRVTVLANILQNAQERLNKIHFQIERETSRKSVIENSQP